MIDVSGHGVPSAMITVSVSQMFMQNIDQLVKRKGSKNGLSEIVTPAEVLKKLDKHYPIERFGKYFSIVYIIVNTSRGYLHYSSAGHPQPVLITSEGEIKKLEKGGPLIGIGFPIDFEEEIVEFDTGCRLFLYTDGITECQNEKGEFFGTELLHSCFELFKNEAVEKAVENIFEKFLLFAGEAPFRDDISIIGVEHI